MNLLQSVAEFLNYVWSIHITDNKASSALWAKRGHLNMPGFKVIIIQILMFN